MSLEEQWSASRQLPLWPHSLLRQGVADWRGTQPIRRTSRGNGGMEELLQQMAVWTGVLRSSVCR